MKFLAIAFLALGMGCVSQHQIVEDNDLWRQDDVRGMRNDVSQEVFNHIIDIGLELYKPLAAQNHETLTIKRNWDDSTVNASCSRWFGSVTVNMYGGLARREEVTADGFALVLCHELSHAYGGAPFISNLDKMSLEGQADYAGAQVCLRKVLEKLETIGTPNVTPYMESVCQDEICERQLAGSQSLGWLLSVVKNEPVPSLETPDPTIVTQTEQSYPKTVQCRLDTYHNGSLNRARPRCWYKP